MRCKFLADRQFLVCRLLHSKKALAVMSDLTRLIEAAQEGDHQSAADLLPFIYDELRRGQVEALLRAHERAGHPLDRPVPGGPERTLAYVPNEQPGAVIAGRYKLLEAIGEGGMGAVWVAEQTQPVRRKVALKLIKP